MQHPKNNWNHNFWQLKSTHFPSIISGKIIYLVPNKICGYKTQSYKGDNYHLFEESFLPNNIHDIQAFPFCNQNEILAIFSQTTLGKLLMRQWNNCLYQHRVTDKHVLFESTHYYLDLLLASFILKQRK